MCDAVSVITAVTSAYSAYSSLQQGKREKEVAEYNARLAENEATRARNKGVIEERKHREKVQQLISTQRAISGASGVDINSGAPLKLQEDAEILGEADALQIRSNFGDIASASDQEAALTRYEGEAAYSRGVSGAVASAGKAATAVYGGLDEAGYFDSPAPEPTSSALSQAPAGPKTAVASSWYSDDSAARRIRTNRGAL